MNARVVLCLRGLVFGVVFLVGCAEVNNSLLPQSLLQGMTAQPTVLDEATVADGLREALRVGSERAVDFASAPGAFWRNEMIRIVVPEQLQGVTATLRALGMGSQVDALEKSMNQAAELAAAEAGDVFAGEISRMTPEDALGILRGGDTAATDYFRDRTESVLQQRYRPIVAEKMSQVGLVQLYNDLTARYNALPMTTAPMLNLEGYVTREGLEGLFTILGQEEKKIRENPAARTTDLLKQVFAQTP